MFNEENGINRSEEESQIGEDEISNLNVRLYLKDKINISNQAWHEFSMNSKEPPCLNKLIKHMNNINSNWDLKPTPGDAEGIQISFSKSIEEQIKRLKGTGTLKLGERVRIKVSGDGTNIGKRLGVINITYTILNEKNVATSENANYLLGVIKGKENYETLSASLSDLI